MTIRHHWPCNSAGVRSKRASAPDVANWATFDAAVTARTVMVITGRRRFPTKEDLVPRPLEEHVGDPARVVRERAPGESAVRALRLGFLAALARYDASTGLNDAPHVLSVPRLPRATPALLQRLYAISHHSERLLAEELAEQAAGQGVLPRVAAAQLIGVREALVGENLQRLFEGQSGGTAPRGKGCRAGLRPARRGPRRLLRTLRRAAGGTAARPRARGLGTGPR
ncbi:hypothetical protein [Actinoallomurus acaciae]|uniref:Uncharacterized protein n=1 Tax=Actinoallomurus acaciae TaxID=502577 RepID=A0ABV5YQE4_9ACTN